MNRLLIYFGKLYLFFTKSTKTRVIYSCELINYHVLQQKKKNVDSVRSLSRPE